MTLSGAENETRTRDPNLGKVMLYQLSYFRVYPICCLGLQRYALFLNFQTFLQKFSLFLEKKCILCSKSGWVECFLLYLYLYS